ncbi:ZIP family metal transporter [Zeaxanthinibacter sp. PT1]|uniref:ZIP family metal transporter n=1 Tax=Zeaxanthinibacter TaxID=561554 RepID=UPI002349922A|nr:ZIP family metal transporter [Zeaxanthinibacter sp. PT1]MDC6351780.1 ZIP family metal transporter [Zeaxanthinibacter sp. PT1]
MNYLLPILAVLLSFAFIFLTKPRARKEVRLLLAFSGAFLLALTVFELLPEVFTSPDPKFAGIFIMLGILLQIFLEFFSKGAEHGHVHMHNETNNFPWLLFISLSLHSFLEGIPIDSHHSILYGIIVHKVPIALVLSIFLLHSKMEVYLAFLFMLFFSMMTPLGTFFAANSSWVDNYYIPLTSLVIGVFLHISTVILFESSEGHSFNIRKLSVIILGIAVAYFI